MTIVFIAAFPLENENLLPSDATHPSNFPRLATATLPGVSSHTSHHDIDAPLVELPVGLTEFQTSKLN